MTLPPQLVYLFSQSFITIRTHGYLYYCVQYNTVYFLCAIQYNCYFVVVPQIVLALGTGSSFQFDSCALLTFSLHFWLSLEHFFFHCMILQAYLVCLQGIPISFIGEWYIKTKPWALKLCLLLLECHCFWALSRGSIYLF